ncbi:hypothetical protein HK101_012046 [Irineochytrium annulatum]|nr:hypothetical protein HK101_012046 [Irineochytrium annulatum]
MALTSLSCAQQELLCRLARGVKDDAGLRALFFMTTPDIPGDKRAAPTPATATTEAADEPKNVAIANRPKRIGRSKPDGAYRESRNKPNAKAKRTANSECTTAAKNKNEEDELDSDGDSTRIIPLLKDAGTINDLLI